MASHLLKMAALALMSHSGLVTPAFRTSVLTSGQAGAILGLVVWWLLLSTGGSVLAEISCQTLSLLLPVLMQLRAAERALFFFFFSA